MTGFSSVSSAVSIVSPRTPGVPLKTSSAVPLVVINHSPTRVVPISMQCPLKASLNAFHATSFPMGHATHVSGLKKSQTVRYLPISIDDLDEMAIFVEFHDAAVAVAVSYKEIAGAISDRNRGWSAKVRVVFAGLH